MVVKKGYKKTEIGLFPNDWKVKKLGEISIVSSGGTPSRQNPNYWGGNIPWVTTTQVSSDIIYDASEFITPQGLENSATKIYKSGTLLMAMYGQGKTRGKVAILGINASINQACAAIQLNELVLSKYVFFNLSARYDEIRSLSNTGNQENLNSQIIKNIPISLPPIPEQRAIATALSDMDALLTALDALIAKKRLVKQGAMQELLTGKRRLPGFNSEWEKVYLNECLDLLTDFEANGSFSDTADNVNVYDTENFAWYVRATDLEKNNRTNDIKYVDQNTYNYLKKTSLLGGEVLITKRGEIGKVYFFESKTRYATLGPNLYLLKLNSKVIAYYVYLFFKYGPGNSLLMAKNASTTLGALYKNDVKSIQIDLPSILEQTAIAEILSEMDAEIAALEARREKTRLLKEGMMQELLTGRIRLL